MEAVKFTKASETPGTLMKKSGTREWVVATPFYWWIDYYDYTKGSVEVPEGYTTDFGSIPSLLWFLLNPTEWTAYILHDYLYDIKKINGAVATRKQIDLILLESLKSEGCGLIERYLVYYGVRLGGWTRFR